MFLRNLRDSIIYESKENWYSKRNKNPDAIHTHTRVAVSLSRCTHWAHFSQMMMVGWPSISSNPIGGRSAVNLCMVLYGTVSTGRSMGWYKKNVMLAIRQSHLHQHHSTYCLRKSQIMKVISFLTIYWIQFK